jgi:hypothetical protein
LAIISGTFERWFKQRDESKLNRRAAVTRTRKHRIKQSPRKRPNLLHFTIADHQFAALKQLAKACS